MTKFCGHEITHREVRNDFMETFEKSLSERINSRYELRVEVSSLGAQGFRIGRIQCKIFRDSYTIVVWRILKWFQGSRAFYFRCRIGNKSSSTFNSKKRILEMKGNASRIFGSSPKNEFKQKFDSSQFSKQNRSELFWLLQRRAISECMENL